jgi:hypothetical protein
MRSEVRRSESEEIAPAPAIPAAIRKWRLANFDMNKPKLNVLRNEDIERRLHSR